MPTLLRELQFAVRMLARERLFTVVAVAMLALGIGANTAIFSVVNAVLLRALPYRDEDRLIDVRPQGASGFREGFTIVEMEAFQRMASLEGLAAVAAVRARVTRTLATVSSLLGALRQGDFSVRAHESGGDGLGAVLAEINRLADTLARQRAHALEATALLGKVIAELDVAIFAFDGARRLKLVNRAGERLFGAGALALGARAHPLDRCRSHRDAAAPERRAPRRFRGRSGAGSGRDRSPLCRPRSLHDLLCAAGQAASTHARPTGRGLLAAARGRAGAAAPRASCRGTQTHHPGRRRSARSVAHQPRPERCGRRARDRRQRGGQLAQSCSARWRSWWQTRGPA